MLRVKNNFTTIAIIKLLEYNNKCIAQLIGILVIAELQNIIVSKKYIKTKFKLNNYQIFW